MRSSGDSNLLGQSMGIGMQVVFVGFARSFALESEASVRLIRLSRFSQRVGDCTLTIEALTAVQGPGPACYHVRLDLVARDGVIVLGTPCASHEPASAIDAAFNAAEVSLGSVDYAP